MSGKFRIDEMKAFFGDEPFTSAQLYQFYLKTESSLKENTFRWRVYNLKKQNIIYSIKRGVYLIESKRVFSPLISEDLKSLYQNISVKFPYSNISIWDTRWLTNFMVHQPLTNNTIIEVDKYAMVSVFTFLQESNWNVFINPNEHDMDVYIMTGESNIIVKNLVVESPIELKENIYIPKLEKIMVDLFADNEIFIMYQGEELRNIYEAFFELFSINQSTLNRYATKRKVKERFVKFIVEQTNIDREKIYI